jgi:conserved oligomeric Golgi complex subunit 6
MRAQCDEAQSQLQSTNEACKSLIDRAGSLRDERYDPALFANYVSLLTPSIDRQQVKTRQSIVDLFLARFTLSADEADALHSPEVPIGPTFFAAMDRAQAIREDCRVLMAGEDSPSKAGCVHSPIYAHAYLNILTQFSWIIDSTSWP